MVLLSRVERTRLSRGILDDLKFHSLGEIDEFEVKKLPESWAELLQAIYAQLDKQKAKVVWLSPHFFLQHPYKEDWVPPPGDFLVSQEVFDDFRDDRMLLACTQPEHPPFDEVSDLFNKESRYITWSEGYLIPNECFLQRLLQHPTVFMCQTFALCQSRQLAACPSRKLEITAGNNPLFEDDGYAFLAALAQHPVPMQSLRLDLLHDAQDLNEFGLAKFEYFANFFENLTNVVELAIGSPIPTAHADKVGQARVQRLKFIDGTSMRYGNEFLVLGLMQRPASSLSLCLEDDYDEYLGVEDESMEEAAAGISHGFFSLLEGNESIWELNFNPMTSFFDTMSPLRGFRSLTSLVADFDADLAERRGCTSLFCNLKGHVALQKVHCVSTYHDTVERHSLENELIQFVEQTSKLHSLTFLDQPSSSVWRQKVKGILNLRENEVRIRDLKASQAVSCVPSALHVLSTKPTAAYMLLRLTVDAMML